MPVSKIAVVYSLALSRRRRVIIPSQDDSELEWFTANLAPGEGVVIMPYSALEDVDGRLLPGKNVDNALERNLGKPAMSDRCIVTDKNGAVTHVVLADPSIDRHEMGQLQFHPKAEIGWTLKNGIAQAPAEVQAIVEGL
jgi:hypothetical protein